MSAAKRIQDEMETLANQILSGQFNTDHIKLVSVIERRKGLAAALDHLKTPAKHDATSEEGSNVATARHRGF